MHLKDFISGEYHQQYKYKSFLPTMINHPWTWDDAKINVLLEQATQRLGELNAFSLIVPDIDMFLQLYKVKEAQKSSMIEGTQTGMDEALMDKEDLEPERRDDWQEVQNYITAMNHGIELLEKLPLSNRLLRTMHAKLMADVRGENKFPGEFRRSQNWIGGFNLTDAVFIPPSHEKVPELMNDLEKFLHNDTIVVPHLIKAAIAHYQFETIHPFCDGNGRIGRLLITFYLISKKILNKPSLFISDFFERNRTSYYDALSRVRESNDIGHWIKFFLNGVIEIAEKGTNTFQDILQLREKIDNEIKTLGRRAGNAMRLMSLLYIKPFVKITDVETKLEVTTKTASNLINKFVELGILREITGKKRYRDFVFNDYILIYISE